MDRPRPILAMTICFMIFLVWMIYQQRQAEEAERDRRARLAQQQREAPRRDDRDDGRIEERADTGAPDRPVPEVARPERADRSERFESDLLDVTLVSRRGGGVGESRLPEFMSSEDRKKTLVLLPDIEEERPTLSLAIDRIGPSLDDMSETRVKLDAESWEMDVDRAAGLVTFTNSLNELGGTENGIEIVRRVGFLSESRHLEVAVTFTNRSEVRRAFEYVIWGPTGVRTEQRLRGPGSDIQAGAGTLIEGIPTVEGLRVAGSIDPEDTRLPGARPAFVFLQNNYFTAILVAVDEHAPPADLRPSYDIAASAAAYAQPFEDPRSLQKVLDEEFGGKPFDQLHPDQRQEARDEAVTTARTNLHVRDVVLEPGSSVTHSYILFLGPRRNRDLAAYERLNLEETNDYGMWSAIVALFMGVLEVFHLVTRSWGLAIMCLTLVVRLALHPINRRQQAGMMRYQKKIQKIQPQINELKEQYKDDRLKMNQELQKLFKENDVNPAQMMGGCLMILLQFPIWIALIGTLQYSLDLRQAEFLWWIDDLSQPDRLFTFDHDIWFLPNDLNLLPLLYVALMLVQQKLQPKPTDPQALQQQRTMSIMMIAFGFIFYGFASGLLVYFITSAVFGLIESKMIRARLAREEEAATGTGPANGGDGPSPDGGRSSSGPLYGSSRAVTRRKKKPKKQKWPGM